MSPFDRAHVTSYWRSILWLYLVSFLRYSMSKNCRDLEIRVRGHWRSSKVLLFDSVYGFLLVFHSNFVRKMHRFFLDIRLVSIQRPWTPSCGSLKVIGTDTDWSATYDFLLTFHSNHGPISYRFRDIRRFQSKIAKFYHPLLFCVSVERDLRIGYRRWSQKKLE